MRQVPLSDVDIRQVFNQLFFQTHRVQLIGGALEPEYIPASADCDHHRLLYREDFAASALHEVAHWCIAGSARRLLHDYGYWYEADGRSAEQQHLFEQVEVKPQAVEWWLTLAAARPFRVSADNLNAEMGVSLSFRQRVQSQAQTYGFDGLPPRAAQFAIALCKASGQSWPLPATGFQQLPAY